MDSQTNGQDFDVMRAGSLRLHHIRISVSQDILFLIQHHCSVGRHFDSLQPNISRPVLTGCSTARIGRLFGHTSWQTVRPHVLADCLTERIGRLVGRTYSQSVLPHALADCSTARIGRLFSRTYWQTVRPQY